MNLISLYIPKQDSIKFYQFLETQSKYNSLGNHYLISDENDFLCIGEDQEWATELSYADVLKKHDMIGDFEAFTIGWRHNLTLFNTLKFLASQFIAIIDNDHDGVIFLNEITSMTFAYFEKWLFTFPN